MSNAYNPGRLNIPENYDLRKIVEELINELSSRTLIDNAVDIIESGNPSNRKNQ